MQKKKSLFYEDLYFKIYVAMILPYLKQCIPV